VKKRSGKEEEKRGERDGMRLQLTSFAKWVGNVNCVTAFKRGNPYLPLYINVERGVYGRLYQ